MTREKAPTPPPRDTKTLYSKPVRRYHDVGEWKQ